MKIIKEPKDIEKHLKVSEYNMLYTLYDNKLLLELSLVVDNKGNKHITAYNINYQIVFMKYVNN